MSYDPSPAYRFKVGERPVIPVTVTRPDGQKQRVSFLIDTGNDNTIVHYATAHSLGLTNKGGQLNVRGVGGAAHPFYIGEPIGIQIGGANAITTKPFIGESPLNLLGRKDILSQFDLRFTPDNYVEFRPKYSGMSVV